MTRTTTVPEEHPGYATAHDIARIYNIPLAHTYRLAARYRWRRYWLDGRIRYHRADVDHTMTKLSRRWDL